MSWRKEYDICPMGNQYKIRLFLLASWDLDKLSFAVLRLVSANPYAVPHVAGGTVGKETP